MFFSGSNVVFRMFQYSYHYRENQAFQPEKKNCKESPGVIPCNFFFTYGDCKLHIWGALT